MYDNIYSIDDVRGALALILIEGWICMLNPATQRFKSCENEISNTLYTDRLTVAQAIVDHLTSENDNISQVFSTLEDKREKKQQPSNSVQLSYMNLNI